jgi:hypothetical protein
MKTLISIILCLLLILLVITLVLKRAPSKRVETQKVPVFYAYTLVAGEDKIDYGWLMPDSVLIHKVTWKGDTIRYGTPWKCLLSENRNLINAVTGEVEYENVALVREVISYN